MERDQSTEEKIKSAARKVFMSKGLNGARMQDIADEANINKALLHYYFRSKDKLFEVIFEEEFNRFFMHRIGFIIADKPLFEKIEDLVEHDISQMLEKPDLALFILNEISQNPERIKERIRNKPASTIFETLSKQVKNEVKEGRIHNISAEQLMMNILSLSIFPFIGKPIFQTVFNIDDSAFNTLMQKRKKEVAKFIIQSIQK